MSTVSTDSVESIIMAGDRIGPEEGLYLLAEAPLLELGTLAEEVRCRHNPGPAVTFIIDSNPNYTNICHVDCVFCAFYRKPGDRDAYTLSVEEVLEKVGQAAEQGATTVLLQGGVNETIPFEYYLDLVRGVRARYPTVTPHFFSTIEIEGMAEVSGLSIREVLERLWEAGQRTIPGGGAEILAPRVRKKVSWKKGGPEQWLNVMRIAHEIGFKTTATMMYGHVEEPHEIIEHLEAVRSLQDETGGFTAFIPWSFKPGNTPLQKVIPTHAGPTVYLRIIALSRLYLDNVPHIQASWFSEGKKTGQVALHFGADDFGGTLFEENVHAEAGFVNKSSVEEVVALIREAGFRPAQRTTLYEIIRYW